MLAATLAMTAPAAAQGYPTRPVRLVVPYPAGGTTDIIARIAASQLEASLHQPFVADNRPGASGAIGTAMVAKAAPDGYTLVMGNANSHGINSAVLKSLPYDAEKDFAAVTVVADTPNIIVANPSLPVHALGDLITLAKAAPGRITYGSTSTGGSPHMSAELLEMMAGIAMTHVPYKGAAPMLTDLVGGHIDVGFDNMPSSIAFVRAGKLRAVAVTTKERWPGEPDIPTVAESGVPGYAVSGWFGILAPAGTPKEIVDLLQRTIAESVKSPEVARQLRDLGAEPVANTPEAFTRQIADDVARWHRVAETVGIKAE